MEHHFYNSEFDDLLITYITGSASAEERQQVLSWLNSDKNNALYFDQLKDIYLLGKVVRNPSGFDKEKSLESVKLKYYRTKYAELKNSPSVKPIRLISRRAAIAVAASLLIAVCLGFFARYLTEDKTMLSTFQPAVFNEVRSPIGSRTYVILPDGTSIWLNAGSTLKYPMDFLRVDREVTLTGEAYFDVEKVEKKRFTVKTGDLAIKVWGTKFNVKAYPEESFIQTTLVEGSLSIQNLRGKNPGEETFLIPNQTANFYREGSGPVEQKLKSNQIVTGEVPSIKVASRVKTILYTSWKDEKWIIEGQTLGALAKEFERRFNVKILFDSEPIKNYRFNGILTDETFEQVLKVISFSAPIDFYVTNNQVLLKENINARKAYDKYLKR